MSAMDEDVLDPDSVPLPRPRAPSVVGRVGASPHWVFQTRAGFLPAHSASHTLHTRAASFWDPILYEDVRRVLSRPGSRTKEGVDVVVEWATAGDSPAGLRQLARSAAGFRAMIAASRLMSFAPGTLLFRQGDECSCFYVILRGQLDVLHRIDAPAAPAVSAGDAGPEASRRPLGARLGVCSEGDCLGDFELLTHKLRATSAVVSRARVPAAALGGGGGGGGGRAGTDDASSVASSTDRQRHRPARHGGGGRLRGAPVVSADAEWAAVVREMEARVLAGGAGDASEGADVLVVSRATFEATVESAFLRGMEMTARLAGVVGAIPEFGDWSQDNLLMVCHYAREVRVGRGAALYRRGDAARELYFLTSGSVGVSTAFETTKVFDDTDVRMRPKAAGDRETVRAQWRLIDVV